MSAGFGAILPLSEVPRPSNAGARVSAKRIRAAVYPSAPRISTAATSPIRKDFERPCDRGDRLIAGSISLPHSLALFAVRVCWPIGRVVEFVHNCKSRKVCYFGLCPGAKKARKMDCLKRAE